MVNSDVVKSEYTIVDGVVTYAIGFQYMWSEDKHPQILVYAGPEANRYLEYGTDYTVSDDGLSIVLSSELAAGTKLTIMSDIPFTQTSDYTIGRIDPKQIESDFDKAVIRDNEIRTTVEEVKQGVDSALDIIQEFADDVEEIRAGAEAGATAVQPEDLATVATTGSYDDLSNKPTLGTAAAANVTDFATASQGAKADSSVQSGAAATFSSVSAPKVVLTYDGYDIYEIYVDEHNDLYIRNKVELQDQRPNWVFTHTGSIYSLGTGAYSYLGSEGGAWDVVYAKTINAGGQYGHQYDIQIPVVQNATMIAATPPTTDGTYVLKATVSSGRVTYSWVAE